MEKSEIKDFIAKRVTQELKDGDVVNLGINLPTLVPAYPPEGVYVILQSRNGIIDTGARSTSKKTGPRYKTNAGGQSVQAAPFSCCIDSVTSFGSIHGGHTNAIIPGDLKVDEGDSLSNWIIPGKKVSGMDGAIDLLVGAKEIITAMKHAAEGNPRILKKRRPPYTTVRRITKIIAEMCIINVTGKGLELVEINPEFTMEQVQAATEATLIVSPDLKPTC